MNNFAHIANEWLNLFSIHMLQISMFILLVWLTDRFVPLNTKLRYLLWMLALVKVFFPPIISLPQTITATLPEQVMLLPMIESIAVMGKSPQSFSFVLVLFGLWLLVGLALAAFITYKNLASHYRLRHTKSIDCLKKIADGVPIHQSDKIKVPVLMGIMRPRLYLPADWQSWPESQVESIIAHEKAHLENRDVWVLSLQYVSLILFWPNPLLWFLHFRLNQLRELRCDETAISKTGIAPVKYSQFLVDCLEKQIKPEPLIMGKYFFKNKKSMRTRINHLLNFKESQMRHQKLFRFGLPLILVSLMFIFSLRCSRSAPPVEPTLSAEVESGDKHIFIPYDTPPTPVGGFKAIYENLKYPEIAQKAGIEGRLLVQVLVSETGRVVDTKIIRSLGDAGTDEAAVDALKSVEWEPAKQDGRPVQVWVSIPILFKLPGEETAGLKAAPALPNNNAFEFQIPNANSTFQAYDTPPTPVGGFKAIMENLKYPEIARKAGIEGKVFIQVLIDEQGGVAETKVVKSSGRDDLDQAAVAALRKVEWEPAKQDGTPVKVWVSIPIIFKLRDVVRMEEIQREWPIPVGGMKAIQKNLKYPKKAREADIEGTVLLELVINEKGEILKAKVLEGIDNRKRGFEQAAIEAVKSVQWEPAKHDGKPIGFMLKVPIVFKLNKKQKEGSVKIHPEGAAVPAKGGEGKIESEAPTSSIQITVDDNQRLLLNGKEVELPALSEKLVSIRKNELTQVSIQLSGKTPMGLLYDIQKQLRLADQIGQMQYKMFRR